jgi:hypothetical protein
MRHGIYVGPYVLCTRTAKPAERKVTACTNSNCAAFGRSHADLCGRSSPLIGKWEFCSACGTKIGTVSLPTRAHGLSTGDVADEIDQNLHCYVSRGDGDDSHDAWAPNVSWNGEPDRDLRDFVGEHEIFSHAVSKEMVDFSVAFDQEIATLQELYGSKNVHVKWGVLGRYS